MKPRHHRVAILLASAFLVSTAARGQSVATYPEKPVRIISALATGGAVDTVGRMVAAKLSENLQRQFIVENRLGGGGTVGYTYVAKAPRDGYTLLVAGSGYTIASVVYPIQYDPLKDIVPIARVSSVAYLLVTHPTLPVKTVKDLVALAKARPGELNYGSGGVGSSVHFSMETFAVKTGIRLTHVPYKGSGQAQIDLVSGQIHVMMPNLISVLPHVTAGRVRALGVSEERRSPALPQVPTIMEAGVPFKLAGWIGFFAPGGVSPDIINKLNVEIEKTLKDPAIAKAINDSGGLQTESPAAFAQRIKEELVVNQQIARAANIKAE